MKTKINLQFIKHSWLNIKRDKTKALFAVLGIMVSIILLTAIGMVNDTMSYNYMGFVTSTTGSADILISRTARTDLIFDPFFDEDLIETNLQDIEGVEEFFPRIMMLVQASSDNTISNGTMQMYGIDFIKEANSGRMGDLNLVDEEGREIGVKYLDQPDDGECVLLWKAAELLNVTIGDEIFLDYQQYSLQLEVIAICKQDLKFTELENSLILMNIGQAQDFLRRTEQINLVYGTIKNPESVYDVRDTTLTQRKLREIGTRIQQRLDPEEYTVSMPKLAELSGQDFLLIGTTVIFWFITVISVLITGILINSILSTSTEERIREYGVLRVVGGKKFYPFKMVVFEGFLVGIVGSIAGLIIGIFLSPPVVNWLFILTDFTLQNAEFFIQPATMVLAICIGTITSLVVSIFPALKVAKIDIIKSITPFHKKEEGWEIKKEGSVNVRSFLMGLAIATIGMVVFVLLPNIFISSDFMMIAGLFLGLLGAVLIGLVFASVGIIPFIQMLLLGIVSPAIKKYANIIRISLKRNRRRNTSTIILFAISFSFIFFITSVTEIEANNTSYNMRFQYGSDLVLINQGLDPDENALTLQMATEIQEIQNIKSSALTLYNIFDITSIISVVFDVSEGGTGFDQEAISEAFINIFEFYSTQAEKKFQVTGADIAKYDEIDVGFIGIDQNYQNVIDEELMIWTSPSSSYNYAFEQLFAHNDTCIIAQSLASVLGISDINQEIRLTFYNPQVDNDPGNATLFRVVGISGGMPGFSNFRSAESSAGGSGIIVSIDNYMRIMQVENPGEPNMVVDKVYINLYDDTEEAIEETKNDIQSLYQDKDYFLDDAISKIKFMQDMYERQGTLMEVINWFAIAIAIFGLISSMYAVLLERKFEIGILRSLGMKTRNVKNLFLIESLIVLLSSGTIGALIGVFSGYLMETTFGVMMETPVVFILPIDALLRVFIISIAVGFIGMYLILIRLSKQTIMDIFRQTF